MMCRGAVDALVPARERRRRLLSPGGCVDGAVPLHDAKGARLANRVMFPGLFRPHDHGAGRCGARGPIIGGIDHHGLLGPVPEEMQMSADPPTRPASPTPSPAPAAPRRSIPGRIGMAAGPILVSALLIVSVLYAVVQKDAEPAGQSSCRSRPETVREIRKDPVLNQRPTSTRLSEATESVSCETSPASGPISFVSNGVVSR